MPALFMDVDGTLLPYASSPNSVRVEPALIPQLAQLAAKIGGALALLSGRRLESVDQLFAPLVLPAAGLHGLQRRDAAGREHCASSTAGSLRAACDALRLLVEATPGLRLEDKIDTIAVHFQPGAHLGPLVLEHMNEAAARLGPDFHVQPGRLVYELKSRLHNKGTALRDFMNERPFAGRTPIMIGDDLTDVDAFRAALDLGGFAIAVGDRVSATWHASSPDELHGWIKQVCEG